ncbi:MAG: hypothetical protein WC994_10490 [Brumimicrobium sp.]
MRLAQISRKLNIKPKEILDFAQSKLDKNISIAPNTMLPEEVVEQIIEHFTSQKEVVINESLQIDSNTEKITDEDKIIEPTESSTEETDLIIEDGVIKAPKIEVEGVKVVGKIDLPEKKVITKDEDPESEIAREVTPTSTKEVRKQKIAKPHNRKRNTKTLSYDEQIKKEKREHSKKIQQKREAEKRKKKAYYENLMKERNQSNLQKKKKIKTKAKSTKQKQVEIQEIEKPKSIWGKFIYWLNN